MYTFFACSESTRASFAALSLPPTNETILFLYKGESHNAQNETPLFSNSNAPGTSNFLHFVPVAKSTVFPI